MFSQSGEMVDVLRARERTLAAVSVGSTGTDDALYSTLDGARKLLAEGQSRLDSVQLDIESAVARQDLLALDSPAGVREFQRFLDAKRLEIADAVRQVNEADGQRADKLRALGLGYPVRPPQDGPNDDEADGDRAGQPRLAWPWDDDATPGKPVPGDLPVDEATWAVVQKSPMLIRQWEQLQRHGWTVTHNAGEGTYTVGGDQKVINIAPELRSDPAQYVNALAHEFGHATYRGSVDNSSNDACVTSMLKNEGVATMNLLGAEREILANGGPDIVTTGDPSHPFEPFYDLYLRDGSTPSAYLQSVAGIGSAFAELHPSTQPGSTYRQYYGENCPPN